VGNTDATFWLELSGGLFRSLMPRELIKPALSGGLTPAEHAFLAHREEKSVDEALIAMAGAKDEAGVKAVFLGLSDDTVIAMASRWVRYSTVWKEKANSGELDLLLPPGHLDDWRAVFLSLVQDFEARTSAARRLWPEFR
jgi:hypothetical protein